MSLPRINFRQVTTVHELPGHGFQRRSTFLDPLTGDALCCRAGGIRYAESLDESRRWTRAPPLPPCTAGEHHCSRSHGDGSGSGTVDDPWDCTGLANECPQPGGTGAGGSEDCLQLNIWIPATTDRVLKPHRGWPVLFYIHGGFLQFGSPNWENPIALLSETSVRTVIVCPAYRLNAFGFLASRELAELAYCGVTSGNLGFWDQRQALEWTQAHIGLYDGDAENITVAGLSAGSHSTFHQLAFEAALPSDGHKRPCVRRAVMWSNGCGLPPKPVHEVQAHFDALLAALNIPSHLSAETKLARLRAVSWQEIVRAVEDALPENSFRSVTDGTFVRASLFQELFSGSLGRALSQRGVQLMIGEVRDEVNSYRLVSPPSSYSSLVSRLAVEYPAELSARIADLYCPGQSLPAWSETWQDAFGRIYADFQVHVTGRGLITELSKTLPKSGIFRYRIEHRVKCTDNVIDPEMGVAHASDLNIWWFGNGFELEPEEKRVVKDFLAPWAAFLRGEPVDWGTEQLDEVRMIGPSGSKVEVVRDQLWKDSLRIWRRTFGIGMSNL